MTLSKLKWPPTRGSKAHIESPGLFYFQINPNFCFVRNERYDSDHDHELFAMNIFVAYIDIYIHTDTGTLHTKLKTCLGLDSYIFLKLFDPFRQHPSWNKSVFYDGTGGEGDLIKKGTGGWNLEDSATVGSWRFFSVWPVVQSNHVEPHRSRKLYLGAYSVGPAQDVEGSKPMRMPTIRIPESIQTLKFMCATRQTPV